MGETFRIYVGHSIFNHKVSEEDAQTLSELYMKLYPTKIVRVVKNSKNLK